jgi:predicted dehydrogenase
MLTSSALGSSSTAPASERVTIGHIGAGNRGSALLDGFLNCGQGQSVAVSDAYRDRREATAARFGGKAYADFHELLARPDIDAVVIATPDHWHVLMAIAAMEAGKHVYVEKPLGICIEHDQLCRRAVGRTGKLFQYGTQQRSMPHCRLGCELVRSGRIGKIHRIEVVAPRGQQGGSTEQAPIPPTLDYNRWIGPAPMVDYTVDRCTASGSYFVYDYSIGFLAGWGAHPLDLMIWGCDADLSGPIVVEGTGEIDRNGLYDSVATWDMKIKLGEVPMSFKSGTGQCDRTRFIGSEGWIEVRRQGWDAEPKSLMTDNMNEDQFTLKRSLRHDQDFLESIKSGEQPISPISEAVRSDIISHLCDIAIRKERKITWDPKREVIVGDDDAAKMLKRPMREPWTL